MKRKGFLFENLCSFANLLDAFRKAYRGSGRTHPACEFYFHMEPKLLELKTELEQGRYHPSPYRYFTIFDPKERVISVAPFRDRVVHHALVNILEPVFDPTFIFDSYATRAGKGTHAALKRAQSFARNSAYYLKTDIAKYFDSVNHDILLHLIRRKIKDDKVIHLSEIIIRNSDTSRGLANGKGLPIGNMTSQFFANVYLNPLDHFLKEHSRIRYYIRYMDDMLVLSDSKSELKQIHQRMEEYVRDQLMLTFNPNATQLNTVAHGIPFLGFRVFPNLLRVKKENITRMKNRLNRRKAELESGRITEEHFVMSVRSMFAHIGFGDSYRLRKSLMAE